MLPELSSNRSLSVSHLHGLDHASLTVGNALKVPVGLRSAQIHADKLVVDLVLYVGQQDKGRDDTLAAAGLEPGLDVAVPHVLGGGHDGADAVLGHGQQDVAVVVGGLSLGDPVGGGRVAEVVADVGDAGELGVKGHGLGLAHGLGGARVDGEGHSGIAAAEAKGANTALAIFWVGSTVSLVVCEGERRELVREGERESERKRTGAARSRLGALVGERARRGTRQGSPSAQKRSQRSKPQHFRGADLIRFELIEGGCVW